MSGQLNVNQFALPGMEEHAHAGAGLLAKGYQFEYQPPSERVPAHALVVRDASKRRGEVPTAGSVEWASSHLHGGDDPYPGEIGMIHTSGMQRGQGIATALYKMGNDPKIHTGDDTLPLHSRHQTDAGIRWSQKVGGWDPHRADPHNEFGWPTYEGHPEHPYEARKRQQVSAGVIPKMPGQLQLPGTGE